MRQFSLPSDVIWILNLLAPESVAYAALELAVRKLGEYNPNEDLFITRAKWMLQKCAHAMISHQELSAQQVASYLCDYEDHFTSHKFNQLFWTTFEAHINGEDPSPECYNKPSEDVDPSATSTHVDEHVEQQNAIDHDEVAISVDENDEIIAHPSQLMDYKCRGKPLETFPLWDFCAQAQKIRINRGDKVCEAS